MNYEVKWVRSEIETIPRILQIKQLIPTLLEMGNYFPHYYPRRIGVKNFTFFFNITVT